MADRSSFYKMSEKLNIQSYPNSNTSMDLKPIDLDNLAVTSRDDFNAWYEKHGRDTSSLGKPMTDEEFDKFHGGM